MTQEVGKFAKKGWSSYSIWTGHQQEKKKMIIILNLMELAWHPKSVGRENGVFPGGPVFKIVKKLPMLWPSFIDQLGYILTDVVGKKKPLYKVELCGANKWAMAHKG